MHCGGGEGELLAGIKAYRALRPLTGFIPQQRQVGFRDPQSATLFSKIRKFPVFLNGQEPALSRIVAAVAARVFLSRLSRDAGEQKDENSGSDHCL